MEVENSMQRTMSTTLGRNQSVYMQAPTPASAAPPPAEPKLSEQELDKPVEMVLRAGNPHAPKNIVRFDFKEGCFRQMATIDQTAVHFNMETTLYYKNAEEAKRQKNAQTVVGGEGKEGEDASQPRLRNQFNFSERATQTFNHPSRDRGTNTEPPPRKKLSGMITQWQIYDAFVADLDRMAREKERAKSRSKEEEKTKEPAETPTPVSMEQTPQMEKSLKILERMVNLNTYAEIANYYKYLEYPLDALEENARKGWLMPLWDFKNPVGKKRHVTAICWNPEYPDLFAVGYGSYEFGKQRKGHVCCFSLKNPSHPEYTLQTESGVFSLDFHPQQASLLAVGLYDGTVMVFDVKTQSPNPIFQSTIRTGKHTDPVWQVCWQEDDLSQKHNFFSVSSDGRVTSWTMVKNELRHTDIIRLRVTDAASGKTAFDGEDEAAPPQVFGYAGGLCFDFNRFSEHLFVVGTEEGALHKCSKAYNSQYLETYDAHNMAVYKVQWNYFHPDVFISCSADWTVKVWNHHLSVPVMSFDLNNAVGDVAWAPYSSTVFAACTADGKIFVFDLNINKHEAMCEQKVGTKLELTHIAFNPDPTSYTLLVGDNRGGVMSFRLSPNLRKITKVEEKPAAPVAPGDKDEKAPVEKAPTFEELEVQKLQAILAVQEKSILTGL